MLQPCGRVAASIQLLIHWRCMGQGPMHGTGNMCCLLLLHSEQLAAVVQYIPYRHTPPAAVINK